jgi:hypothetical protein
MLKDTMKAAGKLSIVVKDANGNVKDTREVENLVVDTGLDFIASRMGGTGDSVMSHMGIGTGTTAAAAGDTALGTASGDRVALDSATVTDNTIVYVGTFDTTYSGAITEAGVFNASTAGTMLCRTVFSAVNITTADTLTITWTITISAS